MVFRANKVVFGGKYSGSWDKEGGIWEDTVISGTNTEVFGGKYCRFGVNEVFFLGNTVVFGVEYSHI